MLKRDSIVKQFDALMKQEIKNHNDSVLASNMLVNGLIEQVAVLNNSHSKEVGRLNDEIACLKTKLFDIDRMNEKHLRNKDHLDGKICRLGEENHKCVHSLEEDLQLVTEDLNIYWEETQSLHGKMALMEKEAVEHEKLSKYELDKVRMGFDKKLVAVKKVILESPSREEDDVISLKLAVNELQEGLYFMKEEMDSFKEKRLYNEKQLEAIFTRIERLKAKVE